MLSIILFVFSDLFILLNVISITHPYSWTLFQKKWGKGLFFVLHAAFALHFITCFFVTDESTKTILLFAYFIRFIIFPLSLSQQFSFNLIYLPIFLISLNSLCQRCGFWIISQFYPNVNENLLTQSISLFIQCAIFIFIYYINSHENRLAITFKFAMKLVSKPVAILILITIFIAEGMISLITYDTDDYAFQRNTIAFFLITLVFVLLIIVISFLISSIAQKYFEDTTKLMKKQVESQLAHYEALNEMRTEYHSFRHDYMNHMQCIRALIRKKSNSEAEEYINNLSKSAIIERPILETGNHILDAIINDKMMLANKSGIDIKVNGVFTDQFNAVDLCIIFSNLLDNAIEASLKVPDTSTITIDMKIQQGYQYIAICNSCVFENNQQLKTTKPDKEHHGFGLYNVKSAVERHNGELITTQKNESFLVEATLKI